MKRAPFCGNDEPTLDQLFADPIIHRLMQRDGTNEAELRALLRQAASAQILCPPKLKFSDASPQRSKDAPPSQAMPPGIAQAMTTSAWPRVFPGL
jgi:hypothetical protein